MRLCSSMRIEWHRCRFQKVNDENGRFIWKVTLELNEGQINTCLWNGFECDVNCWPQIASKQSYICLILKCLFTKCYKVSYLNEQTMKQILKQILDISFESENHICRSYLVHRKIKNISQIRRYVCMKPQIFAWHTFYIVHMSTQRTEN